MTMAVLDCGLDPDGGHRALTVDASGRLTTTTTAAITGVRDPAGTPTSVLAEIDNVGPWLVTVDSAHHEVHEGEMFSAWYYNASVANNGTAMLLISVGAGIYPHATFAASCGEAYIFEVFEGTTTSAAGTAVTNINTNRNSLKVSGLTVTHTPTVTAAGTAIACPVVVGSASGNGNQTATSRAVLERVLKPSTVYLARVTSHSELNPCAVEVTWYHEGATTG